MKLQNYVIMKKKQKKQLTKQSQYSSNTFDINTLKNSENKIIMKGKQINSGITLKQILVNLKNFAVQTVNKKRLIGQNAVKINKEIIKDKDLVLNEKHFIKESESNQYIVIFVGKKKFGVVELVT